jgi:predicted phosphoadenosine phosphosulfate sulfurtransferase
MRIHLNENVREAATRRVRWLFDEFPNVFVWWSGGKDSTVALNVTLEVAKERGRLPLNVGWIDQEAEWGATVAYARRVFERPDVRPFWLQCPFRLFNATSATDHWLNCWGPEDRHRWMHPQMPYALTDNVYGEDRFGAMFDAVILHHFPDTPTACIGGVRAEESPSRACSLTQQEAYRGETWGKPYDRKRGHYVFNPLYDWTLSDVWKAIHDGGWDYNRIYDTMYQYGIGSQDMRVSNIHHETAVRWLWCLQEFEPDTYERLTKRIEGIDCAGKMGASDYFVKDLPSMFGSWREYRDFLLDRLWSDEDWKATARRRFAKHDEVYADVPDQCHRMHVRSILTNDWEGLLLHQFDITTSNRGHIKRHQRKKREGKA